MHTYMDSEKENKIKNEMKGKKTHVREAVANAKNVTIQSSKRANSKSHCRSAKYLKMVKNVNR